MTGKAWWSPGAALWLPVVLASSWACKQGQEAEPRPARLPRFTAAQINSIPFDSIRVYAERLPFNSQPPAAHSTPVDWAGDSIGGPDTSWIEPVVGAYQFDSAELARGRIVARIWSNQVYRPAGLGPWWTYWWIDRDGGTWRSLLISDSTRTGAQRSRFESGLDAFHDHAYVKCPGYTCARLRQDSVYLRRSGGGVDGRGTPFRTGVAVAAGLVEPTRRVAGRVGVMACYDCSGSWCSTKPRQ